PRPPTSLPTRRSSDLGSLPARQLFERAPAHRRHPMAVPALLMQQRSRRLDQALPDACRGGVAVTNYRTPDGFQGLVGTAMGWRRDRKSTRLNSSHVAI